MDGLDRYRPLMRDTSREAEDKSAIGQVVLHSSCACSIGPRIKRLRPRKRGRDRKQRDDHQNIDALLHAALAHRHRAQRRNALSIVPLPRS